MMRYFLAVGALLLVLSGPACSGSAAKKPAAKPAANGGSGGTRGELANGAEAEPFAPFVPTDPALVSAHNRAVALMGKFKYEEAHAAFAALVEAHPNWLEAKVNQAIAYLNWKGENPDGALALLAEVLARDANHMRAHYGTGLLLLHKGQPAAARAHFERAQTAEPRDGFTAYYLGQCRFEEREYQAALDWFQQAISLDPQLRSSYYGSFQALQRLKRSDEAKKMLADFDRLKTNPQSRLAEFKYSRMGPLGEVKVVSAAHIKPAALPAGEVFLPAAPLLAALPSGGNWAPVQPERPPSISGCDVNGDGRLDLFLARSLAQEQGAVNLLLLGGENGFTVASNHPLAAVAHVAACLWGDYDNDGLVDAYLCRQGASQLWRQTAAQEWREVSAEAGLIDGEHDTRDGAMIDADHDGDLDILVVRADEPVELFTNLGNGTFRSLPADHPLRQARHMHGLCVADFDADRDLDLLFTSLAGETQLYWNDRTWAYRRAELSPQLAGASLAVACDDDADGEISLFFVQGSAVLRMAAPFGPEARAVPVAGEAPFSPVPSALIVGDFDGDGRFELLAGSHQGFECRRLADGKPVAQVAQGLAALVPVVLGPAEGYSLAGITGEGRPLVWRPGAGRFPFATVAFTGKHNEADSLRSNASGIGVFGASRVGSQWTAFSTLRATTAPGQSWQPVPLGLAGAEKIDFVQFLWPDGVRQTETDLAPHASLLVTETQRQLSSCPVIFAWNGERFEFVTDCLGVGGLGYLTAPGQYAPPVPRENVLLPVAALAARQGRYEIKLSEPMEEACYLDGVRLAAYDLPPTWRLTLDERMAILGPAPTGQPRTYRREQLPARATNQRGAEVTAEVLQADLRAAPLGPLDRRFVGRLTEPQVLTLEFPQPLTQGEGDVLLVAEGWIEYPYSQTMFAAWQAGAEYQAPTLEAQAPEGTWHVVYEQFGYPAGMPREMSLPLPREKLPPGTRALRLRSNQEIYWDRVAIAWAEPAAEVRRHERAPSLARVAATGFARRETGPQRSPHYHYAQRVPLWDTRHQSGFYTEFGACHELLAETDDAVAIFGPGEEIHLEFPANLPELPAGWTRRFVLELAGWCKDMDLYTQHGDTLEPLPTREPLSPAAARQRSALHERWNTRFRSGD